MEASDYLVPLALLVVGMVALVIDHETGATPPNDPLVEVLGLGGAGGRLRAEDGRHLLRLVVAVRARPLVELLDVGEIESALRTGPLVLPAHVTLEVPENLVFSRDHRISPEDPASPEVQSKALEHDDVRSNDEERPGVVLAPLRDRVEILPSDRERHDLGLATAGSHLHAVPRELVVLQQAKAGLVRREGLQQVLVPASLGDLVQVHEGLHRLPLRVVIAEDRPILLAVISDEPVV